MTRGDPSATHGTDSQLCGRMDGPLGRGEAQGAGLLSSPVDLRIKQRTKIEWVINLKTAKVPGLTIPRSILLRADEVGRVAA
jgi:hypothetical protein